MLALDFKTSKPDGFKRLRRCVLLRLEVKRPRLEIKRLRLEIKRLRLKIKRPRLKIKSPIVGRKHRLMHGFRQGGMRKDGVHQFLLRCLKAHGDGEPLDHFGYAGSDHMGA